MSPSLPPRPSQGLRAASIGRAALQTLRAETRAAVAGLTSRGIFLATPAARILFLSFETHRGPLTITLSDPLSIDHGAAVDLSPDQITFRDFAIRVDSDTVWQPAPLARPILPATLQRETAQRLAQEIIAAKGAVGFGGLIPSLLDESAPPTDPALPILLHLRESIRNRQWAQAAERAAPLIGLGRGLTPSGDDLIIGLLLLLNRRGDSIEPFNRLMIEHAHRRTTALSANLIECAARGEADERLLVAADGLLTGQPDAPTAARALADWGASSGADALAGMVIALPAKFGSTMKM